MSHVSILPYSPKFQPDFQRLNVAWIEASFALEPHDLEQLEHPEDHILPNGGQIFLAQYNGEIVGTVALVNTGDAGFELAKMCVAPSAQGLGIGRKLAMACLDYARQLGLDSIWLESNRKAQAAIALYKSLGFYEVPMVPSPYARADIRMEIQL